MKSRIGFLLAALSLLPLVSGCCASAAAKQSAQSVVEEMGQAAERREEAFEELVGQFIQTYYARLESEAEAKWQQKRLELREEVSRRVEAKRTELMNYVLLELDSALGPAVKKLSEDLDKENQLIAEGAGDVNRRNDLALQMAATIAMSQETATKIQQTATMELGKLEKRALARIDENMANLPFEWSAEAEALKTFSEWKRAKGTAYLDGFDTAIKELTRFIHAKSAPALFLEGLLGEDLGGQLFGTLESLASEKLGDLEKLADDKLKDLEGKFADELTETLSNMETESRQS